MIDIVIAVSWIAFWIYWLAVSVDAKPGRTGWARFAFFRIALLVIILVLLRSGAFRKHVTSGDPWLQGFGLALVLAGLGIAVWARVYLGRNWGMPMSQKDDPELVTTGPYRRVRHPIYSGLILAMVGTAVAVSVLWLIAIALIGGYFVYSAFMEERFMAERFPDSYADYRRSTKMLVPFIF